MWVFPYPVGNRRSKLLIGGNESLLLPLLSNGGVLLKLLFIIITWVGGTGGLAMRGGDCRGVCLAEARPE